MEILFISFVVLSILLTKLPRIGNYFSVVNTLVHEEGHAIAAILTEGKVHKIKLFSNTEGLAQTAHPNWIGKFVTSLSGYVFSSFIAFLFLYLISIEQYYWVLFIIIAMLLLGLLFWIRNLFGFFWIITFCTGFGFLIWYGNTIVVLCVILFITATILVQSIHSAFQILHLSFKRPDEAGDATNLAEATFIIPAQLWGIFFFLQSLYFGWKGIQAFFSL